MSDIALVIRLATPIDSAAIPVFYVGQVLKCPEKTDCSDTKSLPPLSDATVAVRFFSPDENPFPLDNLLATTNNHGFFAVKGGPSAALYDSARVVVIAPAGLQAPYRFSGVFHNVVLYEDGLTPLLNAIFPGSLEELALAVLSASIGVDVQTLVSTDFVRQGVEH